MTSVEVGCRLKKSKMKKRVCEPDTCAVHGSPERTRREREAIMLYQGTSLDPQRWGRKETLEELVNEDFKRRCCCE